MSGAARKDMAPDMGRLLLALPRETIVLLSWIVSEYDGLGFVKTEDKKEGEETAVSLYFPWERRSHVLELTEALKSEGMSLRLLQEDAPEESP